MIDKLKKLFKPDDRPPDMSRRKFIRTPSALAALTVAAVNVPSLLKIREIEEQIASGRVIGQTFYLTDPIVIDFKNVEIIDCKFIAIEKMDYMVKIEGASKVVITGCIFETNGLVGGHYLQSIPVDWTGDMRPVFKPGDLTVGTYYERKV